MFITHPAPWAAASHEQWSIDGCSESIGSPPLVDWAQPTRGLDTPAHIRRTLTAHRARGAPCATVSAYRTDEQPLRRFAKWDERRRLESAPPHHINRREAPQLRVRAASEQRCR